MLTAFALGFEGPGEGAGATLVIFHRKWMCREGDGLYVATQPVNSDGVEPRCLMPRRGEEKCAQTMPMAPGGLFPLCVASAKPLPLSELHLPHLKVQLLESSCGALWRAWPWAGNMGKKSRDFLLQTQMSSSS